MTTPIKQMPEMINDGRLALIPNVILPQHHHHADADLHKFCEGKERVLMFRWEIAEYSTSYDVIYTQRLVPHWNHDGENVPLMHCTLTWFEMGGSAGKTLRFDENSHLHSLWVADKLDINSINADALLIFLEMVGHSVSYDHHERVKAAKAEIDQNMREQLITLGCVLPGYCSPTSGDEA
tara:strand:- start:32 stop:571 length:540 start_codon:yes stop_codon:yes gene_type:complete